MFYYTSKLLPLFIYPLGLACLLLTFSLFIKRESNWSRRISLLVLLLLLVGGNRIISTLLMRSLEKQYLPLEYLPQADVIVVLGGGVVSRNPPRLEHEVTDAGDRLLYAARLYHAGAAPIILVSGNKAKWTGPISGLETTAMPDILQLAGVPEQSIIVEGNSSNTYENAVETMAILDKLNYKNVILVTSAQHMPRSMAIFRKYDVKVTPAPTDFSVTYADINYVLNPDPRIQMMNLVPSADSLANVSRVLKEYIGIIIYRLRGWI